MAEARRWCCRALTPAAGPARAVHDVRAGGGRRRRPPTTSLAFDRGGVVAVATRLPVGLAARGGWGDTALDLPPGALARRADRAAPPTRRLADLLATYPVALLVRDS